MEKILSKDGHYLLHVKENQRALMESIKAEEKRLSLGSIPCLNAASPERTREMRDHNPP